MDIINDTKRAYAEQTAPNVVKLMRAIEEVADKEKNPAKKKQNDSLNAAFQSKIDGPTLARLENAIRADAGLAGRIRDVALRNPAGMEAALPRLVEGKEPIGDIVKSVTPADAAPIKAPPIAPIINTQDPPLSAPLRAPAAKALQPTEALGGTQDPSRNQKIAYLMGLEGMQEFQQMVTRLSPSVATIMGQMEKSQGDKKKMDTLVNGVFDRAKDDPKFFVKINDAAKTNPGMAKNLLDKIAEDPKQGLAELDNVTGGSSMMQTLGNLLKPGGMDNFMTMLKDVFKVLSDVFNQLKNVIMGEHARSSSFVIQGDPKMAKAAIEATGARPSSIYEARPGGGQNFTQGEFVAKADATPLRLATPERRPAGPTPEIN